MERPETFLTPDDHASCYLNCVAVCCQALLLPPPGANSMPPGEDPPGSRPAAAAALNSRFLVMPSKPKSKPAPVAVDPARVMREQRAKVRFKRAAKALQDALDEARRVWPGAELYLAGPTLNLMSGPHHEGGDAKARPDRVVADAKIRGIDGGDW